MVDAVEAWLLLEFKGEPECIEEFFALLNIIDGRTMKLRNVGYYPNRKGQPCRVSLEVAPCLALSLSITVPKFFGGG